MVCEKCQSLIIIESSKRWCPVCNSPSTVKKFFNIAESLQILKDRTQDCEKEIIIIISGTSLEDILNTLNHLRNNPMTIGNSDTFEPDRNEYMQKFFEISYLMSYICKIYKENPNYFVPKSNPSEFLLDKLLTISNVLFFSHIFPIHIENSRCFFVEYENDAKYKGIQLKFTEKWVPYKKRMELLGFSPKEPESNSLDSFSLWTKQEELIETVEYIGTKISEGKNIFEAIRWEQWLNFTYPLQQFPLRKKRERLNNFFNFLKKISNVRKNIMPSTSWETLKNELSGKDLITLQNNNISNQNHNFDYPSLFFHYFDKVYIPHIFLQRYCKNQDLLYFSPQSGKFIELYGKYIELNLKKWIFTLHVDFKDKFNKKLFRYKNVNISKTEELFDLGFIHHPSKLLFIVEVKAPLRFKFNIQKSLDDLFQKDYEEFKNRDVPRIKANLKLMGIPGYEVIPMFMHFSSFMQTSQYASFDKPKEGIFITYSRSEVHTITFNKIRKKNPSFGFEEIYRLPKALESMGNDKEIIEFLSNYQWDYQNLSDVYSYDKKIGLVILDTVEIFDLDLKSFPMEINIRPANHSRPVIVAIDIPKYLVSEIKKAHLKKGDIINVLLYRFFPGSPLIVLMQFKKKR